MLAISWRISEVLTSHITDLSSYEFLTIDLRKPPAYTGKVLAPKPLRQKRKDATSIINQSLMRWATRKDQVTVKINKFLAS
jgi:hypothetical protein